MAMFTTDLGSILDHYADVIEGGTTHRGSGSAFRGIPGRNTMDRFHGNLASTALTVVGTSVSTTTFDVSGQDWREKTWVQDHQIPYFVVCTTSGASGNPNLNAVRKITGWNNTTGVFTVAPALPAAPIASDVFEVLQGFRRQPNEIDIEGEEDGEGVADGYDRSFHLAANAGRQLAWHGNSYRLFETELVVRMRLNKYSRLHDWTAAAFSNMTLIRSALTRSEFYPSNLKALYSAEDQAMEVITDDDKKIVIADRYTMVYAVDGTYV